jgi:hypothetical protein
LFAVYYFGCTHLASDDFSRQNSLGLSQGKWCWTEVDNSSAILRIQSDDMQVHGKALDNKLKDVRQGLTGRLVNPPPAFDNVTNRVLVPLLALPPRIALPERPEPRIRQPLQGSTHWLRRFAVQVGLSQPVNGTISSDWMPKGFITSHLNKGGWSAICALFVLQTEPFIRCFPGADASEKRGSFPQDWHTMAVDCKEKWLLNSGSPLVCMELP